MNKKQQQVYSILQAQFGTGTDRWLKTNNKLFRNRPPLYFLGCEMYEPFYNLIGEEAFKAINQSK